MKITTEEVRHVAKLARLDLSDAEVDRMTGQLDAILTYVAKLDELDTTNVVSPPTPNRWSTPSARMRFDLRCPGNRC
jgi:aspartyl-tRNA(Asn)/glutamyl-tRNA(Gln) amidotransferase subunit C